MSRLVTPLVTPRIVQNQRLNPKRDKRDKRRFEFVTVTKSDRDKGRYISSCFVTPFVTPKSPVFCSVTSVTKRDRNRLVTPKIQQKQWLRFWRDKMGFLLCHAEHPNVTQPPHPL